MAHDAVSAGNPLLMGGRASAANPADVSADGDACRLWTTLKGALNVADAGGSLTVDGSVSLAAAIPAGNNNIGDVDLASAIPAGSALIGKVKLRNPGDTQDIGDSTNPVRTDPTGTTAQPITDNGGSLTVDGSVSTVTAGDVAHDGADSGNPVKVGGRAIAHGTNPTAVAADDRSNLYCNRHGIPFVIGGHMNAKTIRANYTSAQTNTAIVTVSAGTKIVVTRVLVGVDNAMSATGVSVLIGFATATTPTTTGVVAAHPGLAKGGGFNTGDGHGILGIGADDEDLRITTGTPTGGSIDVTVTYYTIES